MDKSEVASNFREIWYGLCFLAPFFFSLSLSIGKWSTLAKIWGTADPPAPRFLQAWILSVKIQVDKKGK